MKMKPSNTVTHEQLRNALANSLLRVRKKYLINRPTQEQVIYTKICLALISETLDELGIEHG